MSPDISHPCLRTYTAEEGSSRAIYFQLIPCNTADHATVKFITPTDFSSRNTST